MSYLQSSVEDAQRLSMHQLLSALVLLQSTGSGNFLQVSYVTCLTYLFAKVEEICTKSR